MPKLPQNLTTLLFGVLIVNIIGLWTVYLISKPLSTPTLPLVAIQEESTDSLLPVEPELVATKANEIADLKEQLNEISGAIATLAAEPKTITKTITQTVSSSPRSCPCWSSSISIWHIHPLS